MEVEYVPAYAEIDHDGEALTFHFLVHGVEYGGGMAISYCPFCGKAVKECNCQTFELEKRKQELRDGCGRAVGRASKHG